MDQAHITQIHSTQTFRNLRIAAFFDCDNFSSKHVGFIIERLKGYGEILSIQAFRDWSVGSDWSNDICIKYPIEPIHTIRYSGKNSTDLRLQRAVLECLHKRAANCIAIASSDSDFRDLIVHIRSCGMVSIGIGRDNAALSFQHIHHIFIPLPNESKNDTKKLENKVAQSNTTEAEKIEFLKVQLLKKAIQRASEEQPRSVEGGYVGMSILGQVLRRINPNYKAKYFNSKTLSGVFEKEPYCQYFAIKGKKGDRRVKSR